MSVPTDKDRPGATYLPCKANKTIVPQPKWKRVGQRARRIVWCTECGKPRLIFSKLALTSEERTLIDVVMENF